MCVRSSSTCPSALRGSDLEDGWWSWLKGWMEGEGHSVLSSSLLGCASHPGLLPLRCSQDALGLCFVPCTWCFADLFMYLFKINNNRGHTHGCHGVPGFTCINSFPSPCTGRHHCFLGSKWKPRERRRPVQMHIMCACSTWVAVLSPLYFAHRLHRKHCDLLICSPTCFCLMGSLRLPRSQQTEQRTLSFGHVPEAFAGTSRDAR